MVPDFIIPDWPAPDCVRARVTTRSGGFSVFPYDSFNLGEHVGDDPAAVACNRALLRQQLPADPAWLTQVHGTRCVDAACAAMCCEADASFAHQSGVVCAILTADCLPLLLCDTAGTVVAAAHAGWRGLAGGVLESTVAALGVPHDRLLVWLGPAIGPSRFEVGGEVRAAFIAHDPVAARAFVATQPGKWQANIYELARQRLAALGVHQVYGGTADGAQFCTVEDALRFFSYRRDGVCGRMASLIWLQ